MTPREYYNQIKDSFDNSDYSELYCDAMELVEEKAPVDTIRTKVLALYDILIAEASMDKGASDMYGGLKDELLKEWQIIKDDISTANYKHLSGIATFFYDAIVVEKIKNFAYDIHKKGGINNYVQLADDIQECYLDDLKEDGLYNEWKGSKYADIDAKIGDGPKLEGYEHSCHDHNCDCGHDHKKEYLEPHKFDKKILEGITLDEHIENVLSTSDFQDCIDSTLDVYDADDIDYAKEMLSCFTSDYFRLLARLYCYEKGYSQELAREIDLEFSRRNANMEEDEMSDYEITKSWERIPKDIDHECDDCGCDGCGCDDCED